MKRWHHLALGLVLVFAAGSARGQFEAPLVSRLQLNFANPGGKSLAMGGAFVSLADDATAAFANPAGVPQLGAFEVGLSGKSFQFEPKLLTANFYVDSTKPGYAKRPYDEYNPSDSVTDAEFVSVAGPLTKDISFAVYRAVNLRYRIDSANASAAGTGDYRMFFINVDSADGLSIDEQGALDLKNEAYGLSLGARFGALSLGAGVTLNKFSFDMEGTAGEAKHLYVVNRNRTGGLFGPEQRVEVESDVTSGTELGWNVGFMWLIDERSRLNIGGVYRKSPDFDIDYVMKYGTGAAATTYSCDGRTGTVKDATQCGSFKLPDDYSVGISVQPVKSLTLAFDVQRILYSQLNDSFVPVFAYTSCAEDVSLQQCLSPTGKIRRAITTGASDDATIPRFGAEWGLGLSRTSTLFLRAGYYREPAHETQIGLLEDANGDRVPEAPIDLKMLPISDAFREGTNNGGEAQQHFSFGVGASLGRQFSIDVAADIGDTNRYFVVSAFYRFR